MDNRQKMNTEFDITNEKIQSNKKEIEFILDKEPIHGSSGNGVSQGFISNHADDNVGRNANQVDIPGPNIKSRKIIHSEDNELDDLLGSLVPKDEANVKMQVQKDCLASNPKAKCLLIQGINMNVKVILFIRPSIKIG
jgi:hypothetical protein